MTIDPPTLNPQMVTLGRLSRGLLQSELATRMAVAQGTLSKVEAGLLQLDAKQVSALAAVLDYPESFFEAPGTVDGPGLPELYHERRRKSVRAVVLHKAYATATIRRMHVHRLLGSWDQGEANFPAFPSSEFGDPATVARTVRAHWEFPPGPVFSMTDAIEQAGGIIVECDFDSRHIDGFSKWKRPAFPPLFFVNRSLPPDRWRWTLAHELGHLVMHTGEMPEPDMEAAADAFAEEFLMPAHQIKPQLLTPSIPKLAGLKLHWKVSLQSLITRAFHLGLITPRQRSYMYMQWSRAGYRLREPEDLDPPREPPKKLSEIVHFHTRQLGYTVAELAAAVSLSEGEFRSTYLSGSTGLTVVR